MSPDYGAAIWEGSRSNVNDLDYLDEVRAEIHHAADVEMFA